MENGNVLGSASRITLGITILVLFFGNIAHATTIIVPDDYAMIQWAIDNATSGDTIEVHNGTYYEKVDVTKQLILQGIGGPVVDASGSGSAITLVADGILLEGFTVTGGGPYPEAGIKVTSNNNTLSRNSAISNNEYGIYLSLSNNNTLSGNNVSNNYDGIYLYFSSNNTLSGNNALNSGYRGINLDSSSDNTLSGNNASNNAYGIDVDSSSNNNTVSGNNASNNDNGIVLVSSNSNMLSGNYVSNNIYGISVAYISNNTFIDNIMNENGVNFDLDGNTDSHFENDIDTSNLVDGKPLYYLVGASETIYDSSTNAGILYCISCVNVTIKDLNLKSNSIAVYFWNTTNSKIQNVTSMYNYIGIKLDFSSNNTLSSNNALNNNYGIILSGSNNNTLSCNNVSKNAYYGIYLFSSSNNNTLSDNIINLNNNDGIDLTDSSNTTLSGNNVSNNKIYGIVLIRSSNNIFYNNLFNNTNNFYLCCNNYWNTTKIPGINIIGGPYLGGNFWVNPGGTGFSQTCINKDLDGICDNKYTLNSLNIDYLPLAAPDTTNPIIVISSPINNTILNTSSVNIQGISSDTRSGIQKIEVQVDEGEFNIATGTTSWTYSTPSLPDGFHRITARATDNASNVATTIINITIDTTPPASITNLSNVTYASTYINWTWIDPEDIDFSKVMIYLDGSLKTNITNDTQYYNVTGINENTLYKISTQTVDLSGNINQTWVNNTARTSGYVPRLITVDDSGADYTRIQDAVDNANNGDTIIVSAGTYIENVKVNRSIGLIGAGAEVTIVQAANSNDHVFNVTLNNVNITGFKITGATGIQKAGIYLHNISYNNIGGNNITNNYYGIYLSSSSNNIIHDNYFKNSNNYYFNGINSNIWNITKTFGTNIIGSLYISGNFWANQNGTGFSQTCTDADLDGICDLSYTLASGNADYLPLAAIPPGYGYIGGIVQNNSIGIAGATVTTNTYLTTNTDASGIYSFLVLANTYSLAATIEPRFYPNNSVTIEAISGIYTMQDIELVMKSVGTITGQITS